MNKFVKERTIVLGFIGTYNANAPKRKFLYAKEIILGGLFTLLSISLWAYKKEAPKDLDAYFVHSCTAPNLYNNPSFENDTWTDTETYVAGALVTNTAPDWNENSLVKEDSQEKLLIHYDLESCTLENGTNYFAEFTPTYPNSLDCNDLTGSVLSSTAAHSCSSNSPTYFLGAENSSNSMCTRAADLSYFDPNKSHYLEFSIDVVPNGISSFTRLSFYHRGASDATSNGEPLESPTKVGIRILKDNVIVFEEQNLPVNRYNFQQHILDFLGNTAFDINSAATFVFQIQGYDASSSVGWSVHEIDEVRLFGNCSINTSSEICDNGIDDDGDNLIDCADPDCGLQVAFENTGCVALNLYRNNNGTEVFYATIAPGDASIQSSIVGQEWMIRRDFTNHLVMNYIATSDCNQKVKIKSRDEVIVTNNGCNPVTLYCEEISVNGNVFNMGVIAVGGNRTLLPSADSAHIYATDNVTGLTVLSEYTSLNDHYPACNYNFSTSSNCTEICNNGIDDDGDNLIDCADPDCGAPTNLSVNPNSPDNCPLLNNGQITITATGNNLQYSINGGISYQSSNIFTGFTGNQPSNVFTGLSAGNYMIRVRNTSTGCHTDYANNPVTLSGSVCTEICDNGIDDDGDNLIDCADPDCENTNNIIVGVDLPQNCPQLTNGQITITASGDNLEYSIDNGSTYQSSNIFTNLTVGNYYITVRNTFSDCIVNYHDNPIIIDDSSIPVANDYNLTLCPGFEFESNLSLNNLNKNNRAYSLLTAPNEGTVTIAKNGHFNYITNTPECGTDQFAYSICDTINNCCDEGIVYLNFKDTIKPTLENVPLDETYSCDEVIPSPPLIVAVDNCPQISIDIKETNTQGEDGCALHDYELTRTWTAYDICGNSTSASQVIDIQDVVAPDIFRIYTLPNGSRMVAGVMEFVNNNWKIINLPLNFDTQPVIFHQVISSNDATPVISQIRSVSTAQFELRISEEENNDNKHSREYVAWMAFEPSAQSNDFKLEAGHLDVSEATANLNFKNAFAVEPTLFLAGQTMSEDNPYTIQQDALSTNSVAVNLQEEQSKDTETAHIDEKVGYLALDKTEDLREIKGSLIGEINTSQVTANWTKINLEHTYANPVVIVSPLKKNSRNPATIRLKNVNSQFFEMRLEKWEYLSGATPNQQVSYMVIEGSIPLESPDYCDYGTDSLVIGEDFIAIDNCDNNVSISYTETAEFIGTEKIIKRSWKAIDECNNETSYLQEISCEGVSLRLKSILQGAMLGNKGDGLMRDDLRKKKLLPKEEPYSKMPSFKQVGSGGEQMDTTLLLVDGVNGIVDWVFVELRNGRNKEEVVATLPALIQCDGDVVTVNGDSLLNFLNIPIGNYFVSIRHRNHLGLLTLNPYVFSTNKVPFVDFTYNFTPVDGSNSSISIDNLQSMWSGDLDDDGRIIYQGPGNDIFYMFLHILKDEGNNEYLPNYISQGYTNNDFNLDGTVIYQGPNNDRANLLFNTILKHPDNKNKFSNFIIVTDTRKKGN